MPRNKNPIYCRYQIQPVIELKDPKTGEAYQQVVEADQATAFCLCGIRQRVIEELEHLSEHTTLDEAKRELTRRITEGEH